MNLWAVSNERLMNIDSSTLGSGAEDFFVTSLDFRAYASSLRDGIDGVPIEITTEASIAFERSADGLEDVSKCFAISNNCDALVEETAERQYELGLAIGELAKFGTVDIQQLLAG